MIRCKCGKTFKNACLHAMHKISTPSLGEHVAVCEKCGDMFSSYPIAEGEAVVKFNRSREIVSVTCRECEAN